MRRSTPAARAGMAEDETVLRMRLELVRRSRGDAWVVLGSGRGRYHLASGFPGSRPVEPGDMVWMDAGCSVGGYWSDYSRAAVVGGTSSEQREAQALLCEATDAGVRLIRPGVPGAEIAHDVLAMDVVDAAGVAFEVFVEEAL